MPFKPTIFPASKRLGISVLVGTGNIIWSGIYIIVPTIGLAVTVALLDIYYVYPYQVSYLWYKGLLFIMCMVVSVFLFGGLVIGLWHLWEQKTSLQEYEVINANETIQEYEPKLHKRSGFEQYINTVLYGKRPNFKGTIIHGDY